MSAWFYQIPAAALPGWTPASVLAQNMMEDIHGIRGPVNYPASWPGWLTAVILGGLVAGLAVFVRRTISGSGRQKQEAPAQPCWETALRAMDQLAAKGYIQTGRVRIFYSELSDILRRYIEARFQIAAPEMTTEEFLESLRLSTKLERAHHRLLEEFLAASDMVKFARAQVDAAQMQSGFDEVKDFIRTTKMVSVTEQSQLQCADDKTIER